MRPAPFLHCSSGGGGSGTQTTCDLPKRAPSTGGGGSGSLHLTTGSHYPAKVCHNHTEGPSEINIDNKPHNNNNKKQQQQHPCKNKQQQPASDVAPLAQHSDLQIFPSFSKIRNCINVGKTTIRHHCLSTTSSLSESLQNLTSETEASQIPRPDSPKAVKSSLCCFHGTFNSSSLDLGFSKDRMKYDLTRSKDSSADYKLRIGPPSPRLGGSLKNGSFKKSTESRLTFTLSIGLLLCLAVALTISFHISESLYHEREKHEKEKVEKTPSTGMVGKMKDGDKMEYEKTFLQETQMKLSVPTVFFSQHHISAVPSGFSNQDFISWKEGLSSRRVVDVVSGCGRMFNRLLILDDGSKACCRYRQNQDQIQGEVFSFYLSRAIGINSVAPTKLAIVNFTDPFWASVSAKLSEAQWAEGKLVILTEFIDNLVPVAIPKYFQHDQNSVLDWSLVENNSVSSTNQEEAFSTNQVADLIQWSDMILFDYLTGNLDRVVNNLFNLKWNSKMMQQPIHNLEKRGSDGLFLLFDNESGLLHSYRLLDKYSEFHEQLLKSLCMFKPVTVDNIRFYKNQSTLWNDMYSDFQANEPLSPKLPKIPTRFLQTLNSRLANTVQHFENCQARLDLANTSSVLKTDDSKS